jgi:hypothetical protein
MNIIYPVILGALIKILDDIIDTKIISSELIIEIIKGCIILFYTISSINNFYFTLACLFFSIFAVGIDHSFWKSILPITIILFYINLEHTGDYVLFKSFIIILFSICMSILTYIEEKLFPEEYSIRKIVCRSVLLVISVLSIILLVKLENIIPTFIFRALLPGFAIITSYDIVSISVMTYMLNKNKV